MGPSSSRRASSLDERGDGDEEAEGEEEEGVDEGREGFIGFEFLDILLASYVLSFLSFSFYSFTPASPRRRFLIFPSARLSTGNAFLHISIPREWKRLLIDRDNVAKRMSSRRR